MHYTYLIQNSSRPRLYTGVTSDLRKRLKQHNEGLSTWTKSRGPWKLVYYEARLEQNDARSRERYLKTGMGKRYLKNRLRGFLSLTG